MKVLFLVSGVGPNAWGTTYIQDLIFELSKKGVNSTILSPEYIHHTGWDNWAKKYSRNNLKIVKLLIENSADVLDSGMDVHYAMGQRSFHKHVLLMTKGGTDTAKDIIRYHPVSLDFVVLDPDFQSLASTLFPDQEEMNQIIINPMRFTSSKLYDAIILDFPDINVKSICSIIFE